MSGWDVAETSEDAWTGVKAERCDENALRDLAASWSAPPQDYWRHRSPAAECQALVEVLPQFSRLTTGYPNSYA